MTVDDEEGSLNPPEENDEDVVIDIELQGAIQGALDSFEEDSKEAAVKTGMAYEEQCTRAIVAGIGRDTEASRIIRRAARDEEGNWSLGVVHGCFPYLPAVMIPGLSSLKKRLSILSALTDGSKSPIVDCYYEARSKLDILPQCTAVFMRTSDWGNIVVHGLVWAGDDSLRASIPRVLIPARGEPGEVLVIESRKTFIKFIARLALFD